MNFVLQVRWNGKPGSKLYGPFDTPQAAAAFSESVSPNPSDIAWTIFELNPPIAPAIAVDRRRSVNA